MDPKQLAQACLPSLERTGVTTLKEITDAEARSIQGLWTGEGGIIEITAKGDDGASCSFIAKKIGSYKNVLGDELALMDHMSYYNELVFYETELAEKMCSAGALCPLPLHVHRQASGIGQKRARLGEETAAKLQSRLERFGVKRARVGDGEEADAAADGEELDEGIICMTKLPGGSWRPGKDTSQAAIAWLARLHALFWGNRADEAVAAGVSGTAGFWHLENRHIEFGRMSQGSPLRLLAAGLEARLAADAMQTMCHGDPKGANIMWDAEEGVSMYDFQWFGKAPPGRDLAYFLATAAMNRGSYDAGEEEALLRFYHAELGKLLEAQGTEPPTWEYLWTGYRLAVCDYGRWIEGGFPWGNQSLIRAHVKAVLAAIAQSGKPLKSAEDYRARLFEAFPP